MRKINVTKTLTTKTKEVILYTGCNKYYYNEISGFRRKLFIQFVLSLFAKNLKTPPEDKNFLHGAISEVFMKKIAVVAANGKAARKIITEAVNRGFNVTGFGRGENKTDAQNYVQKDLFDLKADDLKGFDAVVDAVGAWTLDTLHIIPKAAAFLAGLLKGTDTRLVVVGGAGSLYVNKEHTSTVELQPTFPDSYKGVSAAHGLALATLRASEGVKWTYISPAGDFQADGERSGKYILAGEELTLNSRGESIISYADYAIALVDEIEKGNNIGKRISVVRE